MTHTEQPLVTIAIPTRNRAATYLRGTLESVLSQTYPNIDILVADAASDDGTEALVQSLAQPHLRYVRHEKQVFVKDNFNYCLQEAKGDWFLLLCDDDLIDADFVEACMDAAKPSYDAGIIRTGTRVIDGAGEVIKKSRNGACDLELHDFFLAWFRNRTSLYLCSTLFHTERLRALGGFQSRHNLFLDVVAEVQLAARYGYMSVPDIKASFRRHETSFTSNSRVVSWCEDSLELLDLMCELVDAEEDRVRREGMHFFAKLNYRRADLTRPGWRRRWAYFSVFRKFHYKHRPPQWKTRG